jgi:hypothetical protein
LDAAVALRMIEAGAALGFVMVASATVVSKNVLLDLLDFFCAVL